MLEKNSLPLGILLSLLLASIGYGVLFGIYALLETKGLVHSAGFRPMFRERTCAIFAIALCAFLLNFYQKRHLYNTVRGVVIVISLLVIGWLLLFGKYVF
ncbi:MAG: hypothetical protein K9J37_21420 [Saprospiraceae bacterium]|nr:hypothetical protein [Saprospiraceae bacterium]MCF8252482.1 hypothetical protein [Saprospiraceae bacterium]MCF8282483.1 hypothetical protein [Bacteroidales bacterium]MCF8312651.1 hypothetical protein [Saprospiraceae bacterium]MCF8441083.1 hypothetical protein [Saprospiraceae bacterium]